VKLFYINKEVKVKVLFDLEGRGEWRVFLFIIFVIKSS